MSLYLVTLMPTLSAAMRLSRMAMTARPVRLRTRLSTTIRVIITSTKPTVKVAMRSLPEAPWAPLMISMPFSLSPRLSMLLVPSKFRAMCRPFSSQPTSRQLMMSLMISPKARVTMAR